MKKILVLSILLIIGCSTEPEDCAGVAGGTAVEDNCGICDGIDGYVAGSCYDCADTPNGDTVEDNCGVCDNDLTNDCIQDCADEWGGSKINDCKGVCGGSAVEDACGICNGRLPECYDTICDSDGMVPDCTDYTHPINDCTYGSWVGDGWGDCEDHDWGYDLTCYSWDDDGYGDLCQIEGVGEQDSGLPICSENALPPDGGDCEPCDEDALGWSPECPEGFPCDNCCDTWRDSCKVCSGDQTSCQLGCETEGNYWGCDEVCYETEEDVPIIDLCGICGGDGSSCSSGD